MIPGALDLRGTTRRRQEWNNEAVRSQAKEEGALIARLPVSVRVDGKALWGVYKAVYNIHLIHVYIYDIFFTRHMIICHIASKDIRDMHIIASLLYICTGYIYMCICGVTHTYAAGMCFLAARGREAQRAAQWPAAAAPAPGDLHRRRSVLRPVPGGL